MNENITDQFIAGQKLVSFVQDYVKLLEQQLSSVREAILITVTEVMTTINEISETAQEKKESIDKNILEDLNKTYHKNKAQTDDVELLRSGSKFSKQMEALSTLDVDLSNLIFKIIGSLSRDDVVVQKLIHIIDGINAINKHLGDILLNPEEKLNPTYVANTCAIILTRTYKSYSMEEEKNIFHNIFGEPKKKSS